MSRFPEKSTGNASAGDSSFPGNSLAQESESPSGASGSPMHNDSESNHTDPIPSSPPIHRINLGRSPSEQSLDGFLESQFGSLRPRMATAPPPAMITQTVAANHGPGPPDIHMTQKTDGVGVDSATTTNGVTTNAITTANTATLTTNTNHDNPLPKELEPLPRRLPINARLVNSTPFFYGYATAVVATVGIIFSGPGQTPVIGTTITRVIDELGMTRYNLSVLYCFSSLMSAVTMPWVGWILDRYGPRLTFACAATTLGLACLYYSTCEDRSELLLAYYLLRTSAIGGEEIWKIII
jgi:hypothetical protein